MYAYNNAKKILLSSVLLLEAQARRVCQKFILTFLIDVTEKYSFLMVASLMIWFQRLNGSTTFFKNLFGKISRLSEHFVRYIRWHPKAFIV